MCPYRLFVKNGCDIAIVGAGAAGLTAGIFAAETTRAVNRSLRVVLLDAAKKIGAKILISGGGRCNVTHDEVHPEDFNGPRTIIRNVLAAFDERATVRWFESLGVELKREETGKLFPVSDRARTVLDALLGRCAELNVTILTRHRVFDVMPSDENKTTRETSPRFTIIHEHGVLHAQRVILATGGRSLPRTGSDGSGWDIARRLGHTVTDTYPALVPLVLRPHMFHAELSGVSLPVELSTFVNDKLLDRHTGSLLWTHFGISGPVVMDVSRHWVIGRATGQPTEIRCNFLPGCGFEQVERWLIETLTLRPRVSLGKVLAERLPERFAAVVTRYAGVDPASTLSQLPRAQRRALVRALTACVLPIECDRGWNFAEVTAGGVPLQEIDYRTMASRKVPGLYLIGEMLDCDGRIGGFNFQWAWATGNIAGYAVGQIHRYNLWQVRAESLAENRGEGKAERERVKKKSSRRDRMTETQQTAPNSSSLYKMCIPDQTLRERQFLS
jgi:predicted Rossmann fold flavoprotein